MDLITTHFNADFDGLASMVAARKLYPNAQLVLPGGAQEHVRSFLALYDLGVARIKDINDSQITRLILVDTHDPDRLGPLKDLCNSPQVQIHVYDHHPQPTNYMDERYQIPTALSVIEPVGATTTIMVEHLQKEGISMTPFEATVLALGLYEETGSLAFASTTPRDLEAGAYLLRVGAELNIVADTLQNHLDPDQIALLNDLLQSRETYYVEGRKILVATSTYDRYKGDLAEAVHRLAELEGFDAVIALFALQDKVQLIGRSRRPEIDIGNFAREFGGGGHAAAASASIRGKTLIEVREHIVKSLLTRHRPTLLAYDVMTKPVKAANNEVTLAEVEASMTKYGVNVLPIVDHKARYLGLISRETVQKALYHKLSKSPVHNFMRTHAYTATPETPFHTIETRMIERNQRLVPILQSSKVVGVITRTDLLRTLHSDVLAAARARVKGEEPPPFKSRRNLRSQLKDRLPARMFTLLEQAGELAEQTGVSAFVVGGFVRDLLIGRPNLDADLVIEGNGIEFAREFARIQKGRAKIHERFGTAVVMFPDEFKLDVATARTEYYEYPTALPTVEKSSIKKDLYRRDFTINTLAIRLNTRHFGEMIDHYGGERDLKDKTIRVLHSLSFVEDPTRVIRAIRFEQRFGFRLGKETLTLIKGAVKMDLFHRLSGSRFLEELILLLSEDEPRKTIARLAEFDLLRFIHPTLKWSPKLASPLKGVEGALNWYRLLYLDRKMEPWLVYFMVLMEAISVKAVGEALVRLTVPARYTKKIQDGHWASKTILPKLAKRPAPTPSQTYHLLTGLSDETLLLFIAQTKSESVKRQISSFLTTYQQLKPSLSGADLKALGIRPGPIYRKILDSLLDARLDGVVKSESEERSLAKQLATL